MARLKYAEFYRELIEAQGLKQREVPEFIRSRTKEILGYSCEVTVDQAYEFLEGKHCPNAGMASIWEIAFGVQLRPKYYGIGILFKAGKLL